MKKRIVSLLLVALLVLSLFAGCGKKDVLTQEDAQKVALEYAGLKASDVEDVHVHVTSSDNIPCYSVHITTAEGDFSVIIDAKTGEVLN